VKQVMLNALDGHGGAALATLRLHEALRNVGVDSQLLVQTKLTNSESVVLATNGASIIRTRTQQLLDSVPVRLYAGRQKQQLFSPAFVPDAVGRALDKLVPDVVHLFWITSGFLRIETVARIGKPIVWTLHDMWPFTGGCHYDGECGRYQDRCGKCPMLGSSVAFDLSWWTLRRKRVAWDKVQITVVATSRWLAECARRSSLFGRRQIEVLPNGIDTTKYKPMEKGAARRAFNFPGSKRLILFSAGAVADGRKGFSLLCAALKQPSFKTLARECELVVLGDSKGISRSEIDVPTHFIDPLKDEISQVVLYSAADVLVAPSVQENLSNTVMEALACGLPAVAFNIGGMPDLITHRDSGYLASAFSITDLAVGLEWVLESSDRLRSLSEGARQEAVRKYNATDIAMKYRKLYEGLIR
jgi:glycosyltransferase involved in cell wall biosynthesis